MPNHMSKIDPKDYWEDRLQKAFGPHGAGYYGLGKHYNNWRYRVKRICFLRNLRSINMDFSKFSVLDVGCGTGFYVERWKELGVARVVGIDIADVSIERLRRRYQDCVFHQMDIGANVKTLEKNTFDMVSAFDVMGHIVDDMNYERAIGNIYGLLKPGGLFIFSDDFLHGSTLRQGVQQVLRSLSWIETTLVATGFEIVKRRPMFFLMSDPVDTRNHLMRALWRVICLMASRSEIAGFVIGGLLYPLELILTLLAHESPATEVMICKKPA